MSLQIITIGKPKLKYAKEGWNEYFDRLRHYHKLQAIHVPDKHNDSEYILNASKSSFRVALDVNGTQLNSADMSKWLSNQILKEKKISFIIGGPDGLSKEVLAKSNYRLSFGKHTMPHDLAMVTLLEALYRSSTITAGHPYHR